MPMHLVSATILARNETLPTPLPAPPTHADTSFFTFLIALLILVFASGALVLRAVLIRRRYRRRVQEAIDAGILPQPPSLQHKPELYEVCVRAAGDAMDWRMLMPICASNMGKVAQQTDSKRKPNTLNRSVCGRFRGLLSHRSTPASVAAQSGASPTDDEPSALQVAVFIAMPCEHPGIPFSHSEPFYTSPHGKRRDSSITEDTVPDLMFGVSTFAVISEADS